MAGARLGRQEVVMVLSGLAMIVIGVWLTAQAIGGNLAGRIRSWASGAVTGDEGE